MKPELSLADINALPVVMDVVSAGKVLGLGRTKSYELAKTGRFPCRLIRVGKSYLVPTAELLALLGLHPDHGSTDTTTE